MSSEKFGYSKGHSGLSVNSLLDHGSTVNLGISGESKHISDDVGHIKGISHVNLIQQSSLSAGLIQGLCSQTGFTCDLMPLPSPATRSLYSIALKASLRRGARCLLGWGHASNCKLNNLMPFQVVLPLFSLKKRLHFHSCEKTLEIACFLLLPSETRTLRACNENATLYSPPFADSGS